MTEQSGEFDTDKELESLERVCTVQVAALAGILQDLAEGRTAQLDASLLRAWGAALEAQAMVMRIRKAHGALQRTSAPPSGPKPRLLLVEDDPAILRAQEIRLRRFFDVTSAIDGVEALAILERGARFDMVVTDVVMPRCNGFELFGRIAARWPDLMPRVVFLTNELYTPDADEFFSHVPNRKVAKREGTDALVSVIERVIRETS